MGIRTYLSDSVSAFKTRGARNGLRIAGRDLLFGIYHNLPISIGTPVFEFEWDVLIILDGCRPDLLDGVTEKYEFLPDEIPTIYSVASRSDMWMMRNFTEKYSEEMRRTAYITGNPYSESQYVAKKFGLLDEVWQYAWDEEVGSVQAEAITDRAIDVGRNHDFDRMIIHYMQPHFPSFPHPLAEGIDLDRFGTEWNSVWAGLEKGSLSYQEVWTSYRKNLEYVLDSIRLLLLNLDADEVVLSADHGNAFGEWGLYGHPINKPAPVIRKIPWVKVSARDRRGYSPSLTPPQGSPRSDVLQRLEDLGYVL